MSRERIFSPQSQRVHPHIHHQVIFNRHAFAPATVSSNNAHIQPHSQPVPSRFRSKSVCKLTCKYCRTPVCNRGMKAILLADAQVELFSTDTPPSCVQLVNDDYATQKCRCRIRDVACLGCGNVCGYHVTQPCKACLEACNNGHFWMFHMEQISYIERLDSSGTKPLLWASLPHSDRDKDSESEVGGRYEDRCR